MISQNISPFMGKRLEILVDHYFPYHIDSPEILITKLNNKSKIGSFPLIPYFIQLYYFSFYSEIIMTSRQVGKFLGLLYYLKKPARSKHILYEFIYEPKKSLRGIISLLVWKIALKKIDRIFVQSTAEIDYYSKIFKESKKKFIFIPVAVPEGESFVGPSPAGYLFSAGRTNRDFPLLLKVVSSLNIPTIIVAGKNEKITLKSTPSNVKVYFDIPKEDYSRLLSNSHLVIITLKDGISSRGQIALLEAMALGKPLICTDVPGIRDYLIDGINGFLVPPGDPLALKNKITYLYHNLPVLNTIGRKAYETAKYLFNTRRFEDNFINALYNV